MLYRRECGELRELPVPTYTETSSSAEVVSPSAYEAASPLFEDTEAPQFEAVTL